LLEDYNTEDANLSMKHFVDSRLTMRSYFFNFSFIDCSM